MDEYVIEEKQVGEFRVEVLYDPDPTSPREDDNLCTIVSWDRDYQLGDTKADNWKYGPNTNETYTDARSYVADDAPVFVPFYSWDDRNGCEIRLLDETDEIGEWTGAAFVTAEKFASEYGETSPENLATALACLKGEIAAYQSYLHGEVYGYRVFDRNGTEVESCWGFIGCSDCALTEGVDVAEWHQAQRVDHLAAHLAVLVES